MTHTHTESFGLLGLLCHHLLIKAFSLLSLLLYIKGYLPSNVLRTIVLENKDSLERNIGAEIVTVNEVTWDSPTLTTERSTIKIVTVLPTSLKGSLQEYYTTFLPYVLGAFCLTAAFIVGFVFYG